MNWAGSEIVAGRSAVVLIVRLCVTRSPGEEKEKS